MTCVGGEAAGPCSPPRVGAVVVLGGALAGSAALTFCRLAGCTGAGALKWPIGG